MNSFIVKASILIILTLTTISNARYIKRDKVVYKISDIIQLVRPEFYFGVITKKEFFDNPKYDKFISAFNLQVANKECKYGEINQSIVFNATLCDSSVNYAKKHNVRYRGKNLFCPEKSPDWLKSYGKGIKEVKEYVYDYIGQVLDRYKNEKGIIYWDVINKAITDDSTPENIKLRYGDGSFTSNEYRGWDTYVEDIFNFVRENTDENVKLFYTDYNADASNGNFNGKTGAVLKFVKSMKKKDVPIDGVGLKIHMSCSNYPKYDHFYELVSKYEEIGVEVHITEIDIKKDNCKSSDKLREIYVDIFNACFDHKNCKGFTVWGPKKMPSDVQATLYPSEIYFDLLESVLKKISNDTDIDIYSSNTTSTEQPVQTFIKS